MTPDDYECRTCHQGMTVPDLCDPLDEDVRYCTDCMVAELERLQSGLPKTADGVSMVLGMTVYTLRSDGVIRQRRVVEIGTKWIGVQVGALVGTRGSAMPSIIYSTKDAAEKARLG